MTGVSVDPAPAPSQVDLDVRSAYEGGGNFMSRLQQLSDLKAQHDDALTALNLGKSAQEAFGEATAKHSAAAAKLEEATATLDQAKKTAADTIAKAKQNAAVLVATLQQKIAALHAAIDQAKAS